MLYHYCSNDTFLKILSNRELWLSELTLTNDAMEGAWVREVLLRECAQREVRPDAIDDFEKRTNFLLSLISAAGFCLSEKGDLLSQWRAYAANGAGVALGFDRSRLKYLCTNGNAETSQIFLQQIEYDLEAQHALVCPHVDMFLKYVDKGVIRKNYSGASGLLFGPALSDDEQRERESLINAYGFSFIALAGLLFRLKNPAFSEEKEWRITSTLTRTGKVTSGGALDECAYHGENHMEFRVCGERIVPYLRLSLSDEWLQCINEVVLGPRNHTPDAVVRTFLMKMGLGHVNIRRSAATYR